MACSPWGQVAEGQTILLSKVQAPQLGWGWGGRVAAEKWQDPLSARQPCGSLCPRFLPPQEITATSISSGFKRTALGLGSQSRGQVAEEGAQR